MATAVVEQIAAKVKSRLALISTSSGYENTVQGVIRPKRLEDTEPLPYQLRVTQEDTTRNDTFSTHGNPPSQAWETEFRIAGILRPTEDSAIAADTFRNQFWGDVQKALTTPTSGDWSQWDGLAVISTLSTVEPYTGVDGGDSGFSLMLTVIYRTPENDPFTVR